ncbi:T-lymphocyte surface antigen Ly-9-like [Salvelinus alpinus]|uniref:T-lymphocyte surface antigen Ly-9-like n=1 Tax=Salvelinus alpinus TaxID=8036 RepID=UPI0039FD1A82
MSLLLGFGLLTCIASSESSSVFVLKGQDVRLDVQENVQLKEFEVLKWSFGSANIVRCSDTLSVRVSPEYNNRVEFYKGNFSLLLKNIQEGDSGPYTAVVSGDKENTIIVYQLIVQERDEPPVLTVDSVSNINGICNVTVTCRGQNTSVTSSCNSSTCSQVGGESRGAETSTVPLLSVNVAGGSIICNHSNQVSWATESKEIVELCPIKSGFGLLTCIASSEPSAETSVFVLKGQDVHLDVQTNVTLQDVDVLYWKFNTSANVVKYPPKVTFKGYEDRTEFSEGDFSLLLKNLQEGDSGLYNAVVSGNNDRNVAKYLLEVQERVEPPVLTGDSVSLINGICNVTVTCRGQNTSVTSSCNSSTCSQVGGESRGAETSTVPLLSVYVAGGFIICNHSNQVSWASDTKEIKTICLLKLERDREDRNYAVTVGMPGPVIHVIIIFVGCALIGW